MATVYDVGADRLIAETAQDLKENVKIEQPQWALLVKTGANRERMPQDPNWWWVRSASILRRIYIEGPIGVQRLRTFYGGAKNRGHKPEKFRKASGKIIRTILRQLDEQGLTKPSKKGRLVTAKGQSCLDKISSKIAQSQ